MTRKTYWFQPLPVAVETSDPQLGARVDYVLGTLFKTEPTGAPGPELTLDSLVKTRFEEVPAL